MADEPDVQEITPEEFDGEQPDKAESSPAKEAKPEAKAEDKAEKTEAKGKEDKEVAPPDLPTKDDKESEVPDDAVKPSEPPKDEKTPAPQSENRYRNLANENRELRRQVETLTSQTYQPATEEQLTDEVNPETGENYNRLEAKFEAYRQQQELEKYNSQIIGAQAEIGSEAQSVLTDFPKFNPDSQDFDEELATEAANLLEANLIRDPNVSEVDENGQPTGQGIVIGSNVSPYQLYKTLARASGISGTKGQLKGQQATEKMLANADTASSNAPAKKTADPLTKLWEDPL